MLFKKAIILIKNKEHLNKEGFKMILNIKASMNLGLSDELKLVHFDVNPVARPILLHKSNLNYN